MDDGDIELESSNGFLFGTGGAGFRDISLARPEEGWREACWVDGRWGRIGSERVEAFEVERARFGFESRLPSRLEIGSGFETMKGGAISFLAIGFVLPCLRLAVEFDIEFGVLAPLKSTVCALAVPLAGGGSGLLPMRLTSTQSGSGLGVKGLLGLLGFGKWSFDGGWTLERAGRP